MQRIRFRISETFLYSMDVEIPKEGIDCEPIEYLDAHYPNWRKEAASCTAELEVESFRKLGKDEE